MTFDPAFVFYRDDREVEALETLDDMAAEAEAELALRQQRYPDRVRKGRMAPDDADREIRIMAALADQLSRRRGDRRGTATWSEIIQCLRREILDRRDRYPQLVGAGRVDEAEANRKLRLIESIHDMEWNMTWHDEAKAARAATERLRAA